MTQPTIAQALAILGTIDYQALADDIALHLPGPRTANLEPTRGSGNGSAGEPTPDEARAMRDQAILEAAIVRLYTAAMSIAAVQEGRIPRHEPRRQNLTAETKGCVWCQQAGITEHQPVWRNSDCGFLPAPVDLCRSCHQYGHGHGERPTNEQLRYHHRTGKWFARTAGKRTTHFTVDDVARFKPGGTAA